MTSGASEQDRTIAEEDPVDAARRAETYGRDDTTSSDAGAAETTGSETGSQTTSTTSTAGTGGTTSKSSRSGKGSTAGKS